MMTTTKTTKTTEPQSRPDAHAPKTPAQHRPDAPTHRDEVRSGDPVLDTLRRIEGTLAGMRGGSTSGAVRGRGTTACEAIEAGLLGLDLPPGRLEAAVTIVRGALLGHDEDVAMNARRAPLRP